MGPWRPFEDKLRSLLLLLLLVLVLVVVVVVVVASQTRCKTIMSHATVNVPKTS